MEAVQFGEDTIYASKAQDGTVMVAITPICEALGIDAKAQRVKIHCDPKFNPGDITWVAADGKTREMLCIPVEQMHGWLFTINANKVKESSRVKLRQYQAQCMTVLAQHFGTEVIDIRTLVNALTSVRDAQAVLITKHDARITDIERQLKPFKVGFASAAGKALAATKNFKN